MGILYAKIAVSAYAVFLLYWFAFRSQRVERFRQDLFAIRDSMFDFALENGRDFCDPNYSDLRSSVNGMIRYADRFNPVSMIVAWFSTPRQESELPASLVQCDKRIAYYQATRRRIAKRACIFLFLEHLILGPITFAILALIVVLTVGKARIAEVVLQPMFNRAKRLGDQSSFSRMLTSP